MTGSREGTPGLILTIGHSTHPLEYFIHLLQTYSVTLVGDIRTVPRSRHNPQFNAETLPGALESSKIEYQHMKGLGGLRHPFKNSLNMAWKNASFRGFADYMQTTEFSENIETLRRVAADAIVVLMCAEVLPWRCHRSLIADALLVRGTHVRHIMSEKEARSHRLTPWSRVDGTNVTYPALQSTL